MERKHKEKKGKKNKREKNSFCNLFFFFLFEFVLHSTMQCYQIYIDKKNGKWKIYQQQQH